jgi:hypothetical protein
MAPGIIRRARQWGKQLLTLTHQPSAGTRSTRGNASIDPFQRSETLADLVSQFPLLRASAVVTANGQLPRYEGTQIFRDEWLFPQGSTPDLVFFVSHRWSAATEPDPDGRGADAIRRFLGCLRSVAIAAAAPPEGRAGIVPSLRVHGVLHAGIALGNHRRFRPSNQRDDRAAPFSDLVHLQGPELGDTVLERTAIFYDYSCIPQGIRVFDPNEDEAQREAVANALRRMHVLIDASTVLALRRADDDYSQRGWCAAELSVGQPTWRHIVLRTDLLDRAVTDSQIVGEFEPSVNTFAASRAMMLDIDDEWLTNPTGWGVLRGLSAMVFFGQPELEADRDVPIMISGHAPHIFPGHRTILLSMMGRLQELSALDRQLGGIHIVADVAELAAGALADATLHCSVAEDRVYVALQILYARHVGAPEFADFFGQCLRRYVDRRTTRLLRYRELRDALEMRVWCIFADEAEPAGGWQPPHWATR